MTTDKKVDKGGLFNSDMRMKIEIFFIFMLVTDLLFIPLQKSLINNGDDKIAISIIFLDN